MSRTEEALLLQPAILGRDWQKRVSPTVSRAVRKARHLVFAGTGSSFHCALWAHWLLRELGGRGVSSEAIHVWDLLIGGSPLPPGTTVVVISHRGNRGLTRKALRHLRGKPHVLVTAEGAPTGPCPAVYTSPPEESNAHTMAVTGAMAALSEIVAQVLPSRAAAKLRQSRVKTAELAKEVSRFGIGKGHGDPAQAFNGSRQLRLNFSGGGPFHPIALELALKSREMARIPASGFQTEEILHGPMAAFDRNDILVPLPPYGDTFEAALKNARKSHTPVLIPKYPKEFEKRAARLPLSLQAMLALLWGQTLCLRAARARKINPDLNPFLS